MCVYEGQHHSVCASGQQPPATSHISRLLLLQGTAAASHMQLQKSIHCTLYMACDAASTKTALAASMYSA